MKKQILAATLLISGFAGMRAADSEKARIAILNYYDRTGSKNYAWVGTTLADNIERSMNARFEYERTPAAATQQAADKLLQGEAKTDKATLQKLSKDTGADMVIFGDYALDKKKKNLVIRSLVYDLNTGEKISEISRKSPTDSRLFAAVDDVVKNIIADIQKFAESQAGKKSNIKVKAFSAADLKFFAVKLMKLNKNERIDFTENQLSISAGKLHYFTEVRNKGRYIIVDGKYYGPYNYVGNPVHSDDMSVWGFYSYNGEIFHLMLNGKQSGPYDKVDGLYISPDGKTVRTLTAAKGGKGSLSENGKVITTIKDYIGGDFSADGKIAYYSFGAGKNIKFNVNGKTFGPYEYAGAGWMVSPGGNLWKFEAVKGGKKYLIVNGQESGPYADIRTYEFSYDEKTGKNWAFTVLDESKQAYLVNKGKKYGPFAKVLRSETTATRFGYIGEMPGKQYVLETSYEKVNTAGLVPNLYKAGNNLFARYQKSGATMIRINEREFSGYSEMFYPAESEKEAYVVARKNNQSFMLSEKGEVAGPYVAIREAAVEADGSVSFLGIREDRQTVLFKKGREWLIPGGASDSISILRNNGHDIIVIGVDGQEKTVYIDEVKYGPFKNFLEPVFSPDGKIWAASVETGAGWQALVMGKLFGSDAFHLKYLEGGNEAGFFWLAADKDGTISVNKVLLP